MTGSHVRQRPCPDVAATRRRSRSSGLKETPDALVQQWLVHVGLPLVSYRSSTIRLRARCDTAGPRRLRSERCVLQADSGLSKSFAEASVQMPNNHSAPPFMTPQQFAKKWKASMLKERSAAHEHFIDLCRLLGEQTPAEADPDGSWYCFERGAKKTGGGEGWADVWRRGCFAWEYKGKHKDLTNAFTQLQRYAIALENPPLLVVSDMDAILIHTNFTTVQEVHAIPIDELASADNLRKLKWLFSDPDRLRPGKTTTAITEEAARKFASLAEVLRARGNEPQRVAHFLNKMLFCLFAEDAGLLPPRLFIRLLEAGQKHPDEANNMLRSLFGAMTKGGLSVPIS